MVDLFPLPQPSVRDTWGSAHGGLATRPPDKSANGGQSSPAAAFLFYCMVPAEGQYFKIVRANTLNQTCSSNRTFFAEVPNSKQKQGYMNINVASLKIIQKIIS
jgi:hypothetical protein